MLKNETAFLLNHQYFWLRFPMDARLAHHGTWAKLTVACLYMTRELRMVFTFFKSRKKKLKTPQKYVVETVHSLKTSNIYSLALYKKKFADLWIKVFLSSLLTVWNQNSISVLHFKIDDETQKTCTQLFYILDFAGINKGLHKKMHSTMILMNF